MTASASAIQAAIARHNERQDEIKRLEESRRRVSETVPAPPAEVEPEPDEPRPLHNRFERFLMAVADGPTDLERRISRRARWWLRYRQMEVDWVRFEVGRWVRRRRPVALPAPRRAA